MKKFLATVAEVSAQAFLYLAILTMFGGGSFDSRNAIGAFALAFIVVLTTE